MLLQPGPGGEGLPPRGFLECPADRCGRGLAVPAAGGSVRTQWEHILAAAAAELARHAQAVRFDADTGRLDVVPDFSERTKSTLVETHRELANYGSCLIC